MEVGDHIAVAHQALLCNVTRLFQLHAGHIKFHHSQFLPLDPILSIHTRGDNTASSQSLLCYTVDAEQLSTYAKQANGKTQRVSPPPVLAAEPELEQPSGPHAEHAASPTSHSTAGAEPETAPLPPNPHRQTSEGKRGRSVHRCLQP